MLTNKVAIRVWLLSPSVVCVHSTVICRHWRFCETNLGWRSFVICYR